LTTVTAKTENQQKSFQKKKKTWRAMGHQRGWKKGKQKPEKTKKRSNGLASCGIHLWLFVVGTFAFYHTPKIPLPLQTFTLSFFVLGNFNQR